jgi:cation transporter-like permease
VTSDEHDSVPIRRLPGEHRLSRHLRLDREELGRRTAQIFPSTYSTTVSIVQGVVLGYLAVQAADVSSHSGWQRARLVAQIFTVLFAITVVLYGYTWLSLVLRRRTGYPDATVPVVLAVTRVLPGVL